MFSNYVIVCGSLLLPLALLITYTDVRYRRIPNLYVLVTLVSGLVTNAAFGGLHGLLSSLGGVALAFALMLGLHIFGAMGAGDVKLFAAIGAVVGFNMVLPAFLVVMLTGFVLALITMVRAGAVRQTLVRVLVFFAGLFPGWPLPRYAAPADRRYTVPYGAAITFGSLASLFIFRA